MPDLVFVYDRTEADVERARYFRGKRYSGLAAAEMAEYDAGLKGTYNASDLSRVDGNTVAIADQINAVGYKVAISPHGAWPESELPTAAQMERIRQNVTRLRGALPAVLELPPVPESLNPLDYKKANAIEEIQGTVKAVYDGISLHWRISGTFTAGDSPARQFFRR